MSNFRGDCLVQDFIIRSFDVNVDKRNRITIKGPLKYKHYHISIFKNGRIEMEPLIVFNIRKLLKLSNKKIMRIIHKLRERYENT